MKKILILFTLGLIVFASPLVSHAIFEFDPGGTISNSLQLQDKNAKDTTLSLIQDVLALVGLIAVVMIMYSGFRYLTSAGNQDVIKNAREILKWSIIGLLIVLFAYVILYNVLLFVRTRT